MCLICGLPTDGPTWLRKSVPVVLTTGVGIGCLLVLSTRYMALHVYITTDALHSRAFPLISLVDHDISHHRNSTFQKLRTE